MNLSQTLSNNSLHIFLYHGVIKNNYRIRNYNSKHIEKDYFYKQLKDLKKNGYPISMEDVIGFYDENEPYPPRAFSVTFDDGFANNINIAAPILCDLRIPATFYVTSSFVENNIMYWIDQIELCFERTSQNVLNLPFGKKYFKDYDEKIDVLNDIRSM